MHNGRHNELLYIFSIKTWIHDTNIYYHHFQDDSGDETNLLNAYVDVADPEVAEHPPVWW